MAFELLDNRRNVYCGPICNSTSGPHYSYYAYRGALVRSIAARIALPNDMAANALRRLIALQSLKTSRRHRRA
jgi:hypothetical protein